VKLRDNHDVIMGDFPKPVQIHISPIFTSTV
jgi:hypothetical protein